MNLMLSLQMDFIDKNRTEHDPYSCLHIKYSDSVRCNFTLVFHQKDKTTFISSHFKQSFVFVPLCAVSCTLSNLWTFQSRVRKQTASWEPQCPNRPWAWRNTGEDRKWSICDVMDKAGGGEMQVFGSQVWLYSKSIAAISPSFKRPTVVPKRLPVGTTVGASRPVCQGGRWWGELFWSDSAKLLSPPDLSGESSFFL